MKEKILSAYAKLAQDYERHVDTDSGFNAYYERPAMMEQLPLRMDGLKVLDAGCAAGWYTEQLLRRGAEVTAVDFSTEMVRATQRRVGTGASVCCHDLRDPLPFVNQAFDIVVSSLTLHYLEDWHLTFREFSRVLKPGGRFLYSVHHPFMDFTLFDRPDYFARELLEDVWNKQKAGSVEIVFYRRPLSEIVNVTTEYFQLERIVEPQPRIDFKEKLPDGGKWYDRLMKTPHFLIVKARRWS